MERDHIILARPFKTRNADEYENESLLDIFVDPTIGVSGPFDYGNEIIKGKMGTGKTMYLRANYVYYLSILVPQMIDQGDLILPIYIKLSDYQNVKSPDEIYHKILLRIIQELLGTCDRIQSASELVQLHTGIKSGIYGIWSTGNFKREILDNLNKLTSEEYVEQVTTELNTSGNVGNKFINACGEYGKKTFLELRKKAKPQLEDMVYAFNSLLEPINAKLLLLFDEVGSINKCFFEEHDGNTSYFETLMNQLRTLPMVAKVAAMNKFTTPECWNPTRHKNHSCNQPGF